MAEPHARGVVGEPADNVVEGGALDVKPRAGAAALSGVTVDRAERPGRGGVEVGVGEHDVRALAAELERDALDLGDRLGRD